MEFRLLKLRPIAGMFSNVNEVINQLHLAEKGGYQFAIDWSRSCYRSENLWQDPWEYYFEPCFKHQSSDLSVLPATPEDLPNVYMGGRMISTGNIISTFFWEKTPTSIYFWPSDRRLPHRMVERYITVKKNIQGIIDQFEQQHFKQYTIGVHIRGAGATDAGEAWLSEKFASLHSGNARFGQYYRYIDQQLNAHPESQIFLCSDSSKIIEEVSRHYGDKVITYGSTRSPFGEMHIIGHPQNKGIDFSPYKLGEDVLVEACLLAKTNHFVHGNSNVVNFVLCKNPNLERNYVYADVISQIYSNDVEKMSSLLDRL